MRHILDPFGSRHAQLLSRRQKWGSANYASLRKAGADDSLTNGGRKACNALVRRRDGLRDRSGQTTRKRASETGCREAVREAGGRKTASNGQARYGVRQ